MNLVRVLVYVWLLVGNCFANETLDDVLKTENEILDGVSSPCRRDLKVMGVGGSNSNDSSPIAELRKNLFSPIDLRYRDDRNYDRCLNGIKMNNLSQNYANQKFCLAVLTQAEANEAAPETQDPLLLGTCMPSTCSGDDMTILTRNNFGTTNSSGDLRLLECYPSDGQELTGWDILIIFILTLLLVLGLGSLLCDCQRLERKGSFGSRVVVSFSLKENLLSWMTSNEFEFASGINGLLVLTVAWISLAHTWELPFLSYNSPNRPMDYSNWAELMITNSHVAMDTLFTLSGITISYNVLQALRSCQGKIGGYLYLQIILRFTPTYLLVIGFMATIFRFLGDGPLTSLIYLQSANCATNGWKNILYVNNLVNASMETMCLPDSWYFAVEMQFLLISPLLVYILFKFSKTGCGVLSLLILGSVVIPTVLTYHNNMPPAVIPTRNVTSYFSHFYIVPWNRASPFLVGIFCGNFLSVTQKRFKLSKPLVLAGWLLSTAISLTIIFGLYPYYNPNTTIVLVEAAVYAGFHRFAWGVAICWIVFACARGQGGWINEFLSWKFFHPLGNVSVVAFLVALPVQFVHRFRIQPVLASDTYTKINLFVADLVITYVVAILLTLFISRPLQHFGNFLKPGETDEEVEDGLELKPKVERYGIYYNSEVSVCMGRSTGNKREKRTNGIVYPRRHRYGIYYDNDVSVSMERIK